ncbi:(2Fe-2S)-binding protein [Pusillimonas caeni]|uniref:(2Fe-2S)-binding protein n=1 Tax=Pusillimonas caeni TaxID=1348472 RepID=UPI000E59DE07|nr:(2Fe-2S)-binding protein [Pusillimonas caeni]TFL13678.1 (2Fe-2S)-binding protein [Pusillimonas caeni]
MSLRTIPISLTINGEKIGPIEVPEGLMMIDFLHEYANLTGTKLGCGQGVCHACAVILDKEDGSSATVRSCITGVGFFANRSIRTVEGHAKAGGEGAAPPMSPVQQAFLEHYSFQCGYCTPGFVNAATVLIERLQREPIERSRVEQVVTDSLNEHICRCTGYVRYHSAVRDLILATPGLTRENADAS